LNNKGLAAPVINDEAAFFFSEKEFAAKVVNFSSSFFLKNLL